MNIFKNRIEDAYLVTNLKVMYSTLTMQENMEEVGKDLALIQRVLLKHLGVSKFRFDLIVRNPYDRLESFFKNKFRKSLPKILATGEWQHCHEIFFEHFALDARSPSELVVDKLSKVSFEEFVRLLPYTYTRDGHLYPQHWALGLYYRKGRVKMGLPIPYEDTFHMESEEDLLRAASLYSLDLSIRENSTASVKACVEWTADAVNVVNELYAKDFDSFGYKRRFVAL